MMPRRRKVAFPCVFCEKRCMSDTIECSACNSWAGKCRIYISDVVGLGVERSILYMSRLCTLVLRCGNCRTPDVVGLSVEKIFYFRSILQMSFSDVVNVEW